MKMKFKHRAYNLYIIKYRFERKQKYFKSTPIEIR